MMQRYLFTGRSSLRLSEEIWEECRHSPARPPLDFATDRL
jgi:hypothetical protein